MNIRLGRKEDLDQIMEIVRVVTIRMTEEGNRQWNHLYPLRQDFERDIAQNSLFVACKTEKDDVVLGMVAVCTEQPVEYGDLPNWDCSVQALVPHRLAVSPNHQSQGVARALLEYVESLAREKNYPCVRIDTNDQNKAMQHILEKKLGYSFIGTIQFRSFAPEVYGNQFFQCYQKWLA